MPGIVKENLGNVMYKILIKGEDIILHGTNMQTS